jgi:hypothetical protein
MAGRLCMAGGCSPASMTAKASPIDNTNCETQAVSVRGHSLQDGIGGLWHSIWEVGRSPHRDPDRPLQSGQPAHGRTTC